ncbi:S8 family serine peptidase [Planktothrix sp. FACHB-1365]|uniref:S8 family serine peptidase n=1 Tax=Planktothrix sp. FACHB-1365 TaxID=2692855 RepID=UPI00168707D2|nr:S8 family serine peptidase [Planktothrix sp. FACHB-1365]MBD2481395.1 S8 family serine peptidase [Planktothrix sp. FACHB-1365]
MSQPVGFASLNPSENLLPPFIVEEPPLGNQTLQDLLIGIKPELDIINFPKDPIIDDLNPFSEGLADLQVSVTAPESATAGSDLTPIKVTVKNAGKAIAKGTQTAGSNGYMVDLVLSSDQNIPPGYSIYSPNYTEDVLLKGGRISNTPDLKPGEEYTFPDEMGGLPLDTPNGGYYIGAQIDPGQVISELDEKNNFAFSPIKIDEPKTDGAPDLIVSSFQKTGDVVISEGQATLPVKVVVKNQGDGVADLFKVSVEYTTEDSSFPFTVAFSADDTSEVNPDLFWYPFTRNSLAPDQEVTFTGKLIFANDEVATEPITLVATADSTSGDEFIPEFGRVEESDENNNQSPPVPLNWEIPKPIIKMSEVPGVKLLPKPEKVAEGIWFLGTGPSPDELRLLLPTNINAADTTNTDQLQPGGSLGLNLEGEGLNIGVWEANENTAGAAWVRDTHQELVGRVTFGDGGGSFSNHATHVAGTIAAAGVNPLAEGMATQVNLRSYNADKDIEEMNTDAYLLAASNHSYARPTGWTMGLDWEIGDVDTWFANRTLGTEDPKFGQYSDYSRDIDQVLYNNPKFLSVWGAGNDRIERFFNLQGNNTYVTFLSSPPPGATDFGEGYYLVSDSILSTPPRDGDGGTGFDSLLRSSVAKNQLTVGAIRDITVDPYTATNVRMSSFSSWGPTDDGRVKPDVVAAGTTLIPSDAAIFSSEADSDSSYGFMSGTSVATPNVTGTAALLIEHYQNLFLGTPASATTKGLLIHTAFDAGNPGPDYRFGWGLVDAAAAANFLTNASPSSGGTTDWLLEDRYSGTEQTFTFTSDGTTPLKASLVWTDPVNPSLPGIGLDDSTSVLMNDLDLRITGPDGTSLPWTLDPSNPSANAVQTTTNHVDNVEQVLINAPTPGEYTVHISHTGESFNQDYSLFVSGARVGGSSDIMEISVPLSDIIEFRPPHIGGDTDTDFDGNGPGLNFETSVKFNPYTIWTELETQFRETRSDWTTFSNMGSPQQSIVLNAAERFPGWEIISVAGPDGVRLFDELSVVEPNNDHDVDTYEGDDIVERYEVQGDIDGGAFGGSDDPWVSVFFNDPLTVTLRRI